MTEFTVDTLRRIMRDCAGADDANTIDGDILDVSFIEIGYDSLALLETASRVEREFRVTLPEEAMADIETPRQFVDFVRARLVEPV